MAQPVVHFEVVGKDGDKLKGYYAEMFDWEIDSNNPMNYGMVDTGGQGGINGGVGPAAPEQGQGSRVSVYAQVDDLQATLDKATSLGAKVILPVTDVPGGPTIAMFADPAGNVTGLMKGM
jgi:uncharacterized protein